MQSSCCDCECDKCKERGNRWHSSCADGCSGGCPCGEDGWHPLCPWPGHADRALGIKKFKKGGLITKPNPLISGLTSSSNHFIAATTDSKWSFSTSVTFTWGDQKKGA